MTKIKAGDVATKTGIIPSKYAGRVYGRWGKVSGVLLIDEPEGDISGTVNIYYIDGSSSICQDTNLELEIREEGDRNT